jgi:hypothetical protein
LLTFGIATKQPKIDQKSQKICCTQQLDKGSDGEEKERLRDLCYNVPRAVALGHSCSGRYKRSVSKASQRTFGLSTGELFASNDSKTYFELRKQWPLNR